MDCPHVYMQACRAATPLQNHPPHKHLKQTTKKSFFKKFFVACVDGFRGMAALHAGKYTSGHSAEAHVITP